MHVCIHRYIHTDIHKYNLVGLHNVTWMYMFSGLTIRKPFIRAICQNILAIFLASIPTSPAVLHINNSLKFTLKISKWVYIRDSALQKICLRNATHMIMCLNKHPFYCPHQSLWWNYTAWASFSINSYWYTYYRVAKQYVFVGKDNRAKTWDSHQWISVGSHRPASDLSILNMLFCLSRCENEP